MRVNIEIDTDLFFECGFKFSLKVFHKLSNPSIVLIVLLAVGNEDVVVISGDEAGHGRYLGSVC